LAERIGALLRGRPSVEAAVAPEAAPPAEAEPNVALERHLTRLGREQFRLNALLEAQQQEIRALSAVWKTEVERHEQELATLRRQAATDQTEARLQVMARLFPVLDGLEQALQSGRALLMEPGVPATEGRSAWWTLVLGWPLIVLVLLRGRRFRQVPPRHADGAMAWRERVAAWLRGLELVRDRLLEVLAQEGVTTIDAEGAPYNPRLQEAVEAVPARNGIPAGTVVAEVRRGYRVGARVLRYAQVVVARETRDGGSP